MELTQEQRNTLSILGYLYYRMGRLDNAATVFAALDKLSQEHNCNFMVSVSMEIEKLPGDVLAYVQK